MNAEGDELLKTLSTDMELFAAMIAQNRVTVWHRSVVGLPCLIEIGGIIEKYTPTSVKIGDVYYARNEYEFRVQIK